MDSTDALPVSPSVASSSLADVYAYMSSSVAAADSSDSDSSHHSDISKRPASPDFLDGPDRKRLRDTSLSDQDHDMPDACSSIDKHSPRASSSSHPGSGGAVSPSADAQAIIDDLGQELECGCCSALVYRPVIVNPCQHFFCGSCCVLWIKNGGTNCPACRSASVVVCPSRALQAMVDVLLRAAPHLGRTPRERAQADELYPLGRSLRIPVPREPSPAPNLNISVDFVRPCPHCNPSNSYGWTCPDPVPEPDNNSGWRLEDGTPHGHGYCGNCEGLLALAAPTTSKCDFCQVSFCGINIHGRCSTSTLYEQRPQDMSDVTDLIQSPEVYDCFDGVTTEVERMLDYLREGEIRPIQIYRDIIDYIQENPPHFAPLIEQELFAELYSVGAGDDPDPTAPRNRICRLCAKEVLLYGLKDWWERVRTFELSSAGVQDSQADDTQSLITDSRMSESEVGRGLQNSDTPAESTSTTPPIPFAEQPSITLPPRLPSLAELGFATSFPYNPSSLRRTPSSQEQRSSSSSSMVDLSNYIAATNSNPSNSMNPTNTSTQISPAASQDAIEAMLSAEEARFSVFARALRRKMPDEIGEEMNQLQRHISFTNHSGNSNDNETNSTDNSNTTDYSSSSHSSVLGSETSGQLDFHSNMSEEARDRDRERRLEVLFGTSGDNAIPGPIVAGGIGVGVGSSRLNPFNTPSTNYLPLPLIRPPIMDNGMGSGMSMGMDD